MGGNGKHRWKISCYRSNFSSKNPPNKLLCPIFGSLISDPIVVSSGQTFERLSVQLCHKLSFSPQTPDFSTVIHNFAIKSTIQNWCNRNNAQYPQASDSIALEKTVRALMEKDRKDPGIRVSERELLRGMTKMPKVRFMARRPFIFQFVVRVGGHPLGESPHSSFLRNPAVVLLLVVFLRNHHRASNLKP